MMRRSNQSDELFNQNDFGVGYISEDLRFLKTNEYLENFLSYRRHELHNKPLATIFSKEDFHKLKAEFEAVKSQPLFSHQQNFLTKDDISLLGGLSLRAIFDKDKNFKYYMVYIFDYVSYFFENSKSQVNRDILKKIFDYVEDVMFFKDSKFRYQIVNKSFLDHTNMELEDIVGKSDRDIFPENLANIYNKNNLEVKEKKTHKTYETTYKKRGSDNIYKCRITLHGIFDGDTFLGILGTAYDLSLDNELKYRQTLIQNMFEHSSEGMLITDSHEKIIAVNDSFTKMTKYDQNDVIGFKPSILSSGRHDEKFYKNMWEDIEKDGQWHGEIINKRKNGEEYPAVVTITSIKDDYGNVVNYAGMFSDMFKLREAEKKLQYLSKNDALTALPNKFSLELNMHQIIKRAKRNRYLVGFLYFDLDNFKEINDTFSHTMGDKVLVQVAQRLQNLLRDMDIIARVGGDEFMVVVENFKTIENIKIIIDKIFDIFKNPFIVDDKIFNMTCSLGVAIYPNDGTDADSIFKNTDAAMYEAKNSGKNSFHFYTKSITKTLMEKIEIENDMRRGLENDEFFVLYQPQIDMLSDKIIGAEALVRWNHPTKGLLPPNLFIPIAEENKLISKIGSVVLEKVCMDIKSWLDLGINLTDFGVSVNISAVQLKEEDIYETITKITSLAKILPKHLKVELTETSIMENSNKVIDLFGRLNKIGVKLSIDDFGTGYSSFVYLKRFATSQIKIDRTFIKNIPEDKDDMAITRTILALGKSLELDVIAEGLEEIKHKEFLLKEGCRKAQGFLYSKPISKDMLEKKFLKLL